MHHDELIAAPSAVQDFATRQHNTVMQTNEQEFHWTTTLT